MGATAVEQGDVAAPAQAPPAGGRGPSEGAPRPSVFISYRREPDVLDPARRFAADLRREQVAVAFDEFASEEEFQRGGPPGGWPAWCERHVEDGRVFVVGSAGWYDRYRMTPAAPRDEGLGAAFEAFLVRNRCYYGPNFHLVRLVLLHDGARRGIPVALSSVPRFEWPRDHAGILRWLRQSDAEHMDELVRSAASYPPATLAFVEGVRAIAAHLVPPVLLLASVAVSVVALCAALAAVLASLAWPSVLAPELLAIFVTAALVVALLPLSAVGGAVFMYILRFFGPNGETRP